MPHASSRFVSNEEITKELKKLMVVILKVLGNGDVRKGAKFVKENREKCTCPWQLGMGPELHCPVHGRPELTTEESRRRHLER